MSINSSSNRLSVLTKDLLMKWEQTKEQWTDQKAREFEQKYLNELMSSVNTAVMASKELDKIIAKIRHDCE